MTTNKSTNNTSEKSKPYQCEIDIAFPTSLHALHAKQVLEVDREIGDKVVKSFAILHPEPPNDNNNNDPITNDNASTHHKQQKNESRVLRM